MDDKTEKQRIIDIIDESIIRFLKNRNDALDDYSISELFPNEKEYLEARSLFAQRMGVDNTVVEKIFDLLYVDSETNRQ